MRGDLDEASSPMRRTQRQPMTCPSDSQLQHLAEGGAGGASLEELHGHLIDCEPCRLAVVAASQVVPVLQLTEVVQEPAPPSPSGQRMLGRYALGAQLGRGG